MLLRDNVKSLQSHSLFGCGATRESVTHFEFVIASLCQNHFCPFIKPHVDALHVKMGKCQISCDAGACHTRT